MINYDSEPGVTCRDSGSSWHDRRPTRMIIMACSTSIRHGLCSPGPGPLIAAAGVGVTGPVPVARRRHGRPPGPAAPLAGARQ